MQILQSGRMVSIPLLFFATFITLGVLALNVPINEVSPSFLKAVLVDIMLTVPLICLALLATQKFPLIAAVPFFVIGLNVALLASPPELHPFAEAVRWASISIILGILALAVLKIARKTRQAAPHVAGIVDARDKMEKLSGIVVGSDRKAKIFASDWAFVRYAICPPEKASVHQTLQMSSHQTSGFVALLWAIVGLIILETLILHVLVHLLLPTVAWVLTIISLYSVLSLVGHIRALPRRYTTFGVECVTLRVGLFGQCEIRYNQIEKIEHISPNTSLPDGAVRLGILGAIEPSNIMIKLRGPAQAHITHGLSRRSHILVFHIEDPKAFAAEITRRNLHNIIADQTVR